MHVSRLEERIALGRLVRERAWATVEARGRQAEMAAWLAARAPGLSEQDRAFQEAVAARVSRMFAFVGCEHQH